MTVKSSRRGDAAIPKTTPTVIPAHAGIHPVGAECETAGSRSQDVGSGKRMEFPGRGNDGQADWIPASAGMTVKRMDSRVRGNDGASGHFP